MRLIDEKLDPPVHFGKDSKDHLRFNSWSKKTLNYLDAKYPGFRVAMKWPADQGERVITAQEVARSGWPDNTLGNPALYNCFVKVLHGEALLLAETATDNWLEAFRLLNVRYDRPGAVNDREVSQVHKSNAGQELAGAAPRDHGLGV